jgi:hypothetical protein
MEGASRNALRDAYYALFLARQPLNGLDGMGRAAPAQEFDFLVFERVRSPEELFQLISRA